MPAERCDKPVVPQHARTTANMGASLGCAQPASACRGVSNPKSPTGLGGISTHPHQKAGAAWKDPALGTPSPPALLPERGCSGFQQGTRYLLNRGLLGDIVHHADHVGLQERSSRGW